MGRRPKWSKEKIINEIKVLCQNGVDLRQENIKKEFPTLFSAANRYFGSWAKAVKVTGIDYSSIKARSERLRCARIKKWSPEKVIEEIKKIPENELSRISRENLALHSAARREFGSWENALRAAGYDYWQLREMAAPGFTRWNKEKIIRKIKELIASQEEPGKGLNITKRYPSLYLVAWQYFGSWRKALEEAGCDKDFINLNTQGMRKWTKKKVVEKILNFYQAGENLQAINVYKKHRDLSSAAIREFGGWKKAIAAAGLDYQEIKKSAKS